MGVVYPWLFESERGIIMFKMFGINKNKAQALVSRTHKKYCRELKNMVRSELSLIFADIKKECNIGNCSSTYKFRFAEDVCSQVVACLKRRGFTAYTSKTADDDGDVIFCHVMW